ncbi:FadR family transcriptional regulator [Cryobacterium sp. TMS1-20-1]|uniref:FadR/GntR family transcriptional regulator n=1 Tax=unclassified Cryobacterium TaxID=2649013 RepID=UPI00106CB200|nr:MULTISPECIES: FCD domain-containing protein [unclassified Cryobacterium]TFC74004.1 FadR family transcriptional regulator [Cryobacterium sp. TMS1-20-1]TFD53788.1 FadR family transcriptional regulator [Cryobacterium sp. Hh11]
MAVTDEAILKIKDMILSGEIKPRDKLPPEKELSERLGLSRSSLREAVKALEVIRVLDVRRGDGTYVTSLEPRLLLEAMTFITDLHTDSSILELFAVRRILEPAAAALAAVRMSPQELAELRALLELVNESTDVEGLVAADIHFHGAIAAAAGNTYLASLIDSLSSHTIRARIWRGLTQEHSVERTLAEHKAIADALERHDADLAQALTTVHISGIEQWLRDAVAAA